MIASRNDLLSAVRRADLTPKGLQVGPVAYVDGRDILFGKVTTEEMRRQLINKIQLAGSKYFQPNTIWDLPCLEKTKSSSRSGKGRKKATPTDDGVPF